MSAKFMPKIRPFAASAFYQHILATPYNKWQGGIKYEVGDMVQSYGNKYLCILGGTSGGNAPAGTTKGQIVSDGIVNWLYIETVESKRSIYLAIGKPTAWTEETAPDDVGLGDKDEYTTLKNIIALKRITQSDIRNGITRYNWIENTVYDQYDHHKDPLVYGSNDTFYTNPFYVIVHDDDESYKLYKCINNNNGAMSTIQPTATITDAYFELSDGYVWKYMGKVKEIDKDFITYSHIPLSPINDVESDQYAIHVNSLSHQCSLSTFKLLNQIGTFNVNVATTTTVIGGTPTTNALAKANVKLDKVNQVLVDNNECGQGYDYNQKVYAITKITSAVGSGASVGPITVSDGGVITAIEVGETGFDYTGGAIVVLYDPAVTGTDNITSKAITSVTVNGDGSIQKIDVVDGGLGYTNSVKGWIIPGIAGCVAEAIFAPRGGHGVDAQAELCANSLIINAKLDSEQVNYFLSGEANAFRQVSIVADIVDKTTGAIKDDNYCIGYSHPLYESANSTLNKMKWLQGKLLYTNNLQKVIRTTDQSESIKIVITF